MQSTCDQYPELYAEKLRLQGGHNRSPRGSTLSAVVFSIKNRCVNVLMRSLELQGFTMQTLSFDGLHLSS